jgi:hypothetical protein
MNLIKPSTGCNISVDQTLDFTDGNNILFTVSMNDTEIVSGNVVAVAKWLCASIDNKDVKVPSKFVVTFAKMALDSLA